VPKGTTHKPFDVVRLEQKAVPYDSATSVPQPGSNYMGKSFPQVSANEIPNLTDLFNGWK
jgi:hypothetical protein